MRSYWQFTVLFSFFVTTYSAFTDDLKECIQKAIVTPGMRERISFCHLVPPNLCHRPVNSSAPLAPPEILYSYFFPDILFWDPLSRIPSLKASSNAQEKHVQGKTASLGSSGGKMARPIGIILVDCMA